jgi:hypothetical protein
MERIAWMGDGEQSTLGLLIPAAGASVAIVSVLLSVAARKKELTCTLLSATRLVSENLGGISPEMRVEFRGQTIYSLSKMTFSLRNTGSAAVRAQDVSEPIHLQFPAGARLLSAAVERTLPLKFAFSAKQVQEAGQVALDFPLLNSGDEAIFSVYVLNSEPERPSFEGRVVDVPQLVYTESASVNGAGADWPRWSHSTRTVVRRSLLVLYGALSLAAFSFWAYAVFTRLGYMLWKPKWIKPYAEAEEEANKKAKEEWDQRFEVRLKQAANMSRSEAQAYLQKPASKELNIIETRRRALEEELRERGIPPKPDQLIEAAFLSFSLVFLGSAVVFVITVVVVHTALLG